MPLQGLDTVLVLIVPAFSFRYEVVPAVVVLHTVDALVMALKGEVGTLGPTKVTKESF